MTVIHPFLAGAEGYGAAMAQFQLLQAYAAATLSLVLAILPWGRLVTRWFCLGFALVCIYLIEESYRLNQPLPWSIVVLLLPLAISCVSVFVSFRLSHGKKAR